MIILFFYFILFCNFVCYYNMKDSKLIIYLSDFTIVTNTDK